MISFTPDSLKPAWRLHNWQQMTSGKKSLHAIWLFETTKRKNSMIWVMLYVLLSGSASGLVYDISDPVEQYIAVEATAKQIIAINKEMLQVEAKHAEVNTKAKTELADINANRLTESDIKAVLIEMENQRIVARNRIIEMRFKIRELMSAEEWRNVYAAASQHD